MKVKGNYLGTVSEREIAYAKAKKDNLKIRMFENRLSYLHEQGIYEGTEVDEVLDRLFKEYSDLAFGIGIEY